MTTALTDARTAWETFIETRYQMLLPQGFSTVMQHFMNALWVLGSSPSTYTGNIYTDYTHDASDRCTLIEMFSDAGKTVHLFTIANVYTSGELDSSTMTNHVTGEIVTSTYTYGATKLLTDAAVVKT
jgi:hypothetical protein